jgi:hypothetical protein
MLSSNQNTTPTASLDTLRNMANEAHQAASKHQDKIIWYKRAVAYLRLIPHSNRTNQDWINLSTIQQALSFLCQDDEDKVRWGKQALASWQKISKETITSDRWRKIAKQANEAAIQVQSDISKISWHRQAICALYSIPAQNLQHNDWINLAIDAQSISELFDENHEKIHWLRQAISNLEQIPIMNLTDANWFQKSECLNQLSTLVREPQLKLLLREKIEQCRTHTGQPNQRQRVSVRQTIVTTVTTEEMSNHNTIMNQLRAKAMTHYHKAQECSDANQKFNYFQGAIIFFNLIEKILNEDRRIMSLCDMALGQLSNQFDQKFAWYFQGLTNSMAIPPHERASIDWRSLAMMQTQCSYFFIDLKQKRVLLKDALKSLELISEQERTSLDWVNVAICLQNIGLTYKNTNCVKEKEYLNASRNVGNLHISNNNFSYQGACETNSYLSNLESPSDPAIFLSNPITKTAFFSSHPTLFKASSQTDPRLTSDKRMMDDSDTIKEKNKKPKR